MGFTKSSWPAFVDKLQNLVDAQGNEVVRAVSGSGEYILAPSFSSFYISPTIWYRMSKQSCCEHMRKMVRHYHRSVKESPECLPESQPHKISILPRDVQLATVSLATIESVWQKAEKILNDLGSIVHAPGSDSAYMVASRTSARPHFVQLSKNGKVSGV